MVVFKGLVPPHFTSLCYTGVDEKKRRDARRFTVHLARLAFAREQATYNVEIVIDSISIKRYQCNPIKNICDSHIFWSGLIDRSIGWVYWPACMRDVLDSLVKSNGLLSVCVLTS